MRFPAFILVCAGLSFGARAWAAAEPPPPGPNLDQQEDDQTRFGDETAEDKGILPASANLRLSTQTVTPVSLFPEKALYDQGREELVRAEALWAKGDAEGASDTALEAYDDLVEIHRRKKKERKKLYAERRRAAAVYVQSSIRFIQDFVENRGRREQTLEEGRARLEDLRDVARNYEDLHHLLNKAIEQLAGPPSAH